MANRGRGRGRYHSGLHFEALEPRLALDASMLRITEFVASNDNGITDADGDNSDWIEIYNAGNDAVDLTGLHLTDNASNLSKWTFPSSTALPAGGYRLVFASSKNTVKPNGELHTNFSLSAGGEYLGLIGANGTTIIDQFAPQFPSQREDVSYGQAMNVTGATTTLVASNAQATAWIPTSNVYDSTWRGLGFNDASFNINGQTGIGYENNPFDLINFTDEIHTTVPSGTKSVYIRISFNLATLTGVDQLLLRMKYDDGFVAYINGVQVAEANSPETPQWDSQASANHDDTLSDVFQDFDVSSVIPQLNLGQNVLAIHGLNLATGSDMLILPELIAKQSVLAVPTDVGYFDTVTPGYSNVASNFGGFVEDVGFSVPHGFYSSTQNVSLSTTTPGAIVVYTTNGSTPTVNAALGITNGMLYTGPIAFSTTRVLRAAAFKADFKPSFITSSTYVFVNDVINQSLAGQVPAGWAPNGVNGQEINYGIDPDIVNFYGAQAVKNSLTSIPSISITTDLANLFDPATGIYVNAGNRGPSWEKLAGVELINPDGSTGFTTNAGLRIRGGYSRNDYNPKHAFRFYFRSEYGDGKLEYPLFGDEGVDEFDVLDLRTEQNYSWSGDGNAQNTFVREVFARDTQGDLGSEYTRSRYYHLYIDGVYWGVYQTQERVEKFFSESYFGGVESDYDIVKSGLGDVGGTEISEGNDAAWHQLFNYGEALAANPVANANVYWTMQGLNPDGTRNASLPVLLDVDNLIDYMLIIFYTGGFDTGISRWINDDIANNWFGVYNHVTADQGFQFFIHDNEHALGSDYPDHASQFIDRTGPFNNGSQSNYAQFAPPFLHQDLLTSPEYKQRFIDHVQEHMFNSGALTVQANIERFLERKNQVDPAIIAEAARWGDSKVGVPYNKASWQNEINWIVNSYFPTRGNTVLSQLQGDGLFTTFSAPSFSQFGGQVLNNYPLSMTASLGPIYYTTDGVTDPRLVGGGINPSAAVKSYIGSVPISGETTVMARLRNPSGQWSGLVKATFTTIELAGDYNGSGTINENDFDVWKSSYGNTVAVAGSGADGNHDGNVDALDYSVWHNNFGATLPPGAGGLAAELALTSTNVPAGKSVADNALPEVALQPQLNAVTDELFALGGPTAPQFARTSIVGKAAFDNLLLAAATSDAGLSDDEALDSVLAEFTSSDDVDDDLLATLAVEALEMPLLQP